MSSTDQCHFSDDVAQTLDFICGGNLDGKTKRECLLCGEAVDAFSSTYFWGESETADRMKSRSTVEHLIRQRSGCLDITNILLLVTPVEFPKEQKNCQTVHCYRLDNRSHLGVSTFTEEEISLIECYHGPNNYSIVYCTAYIDPQDAARNTPIKGEVFEMVRESPRAVRSTWYKGQVVRLGYRCSRSQLVGVSPPKRNIFGIRSLEQPKIPVRMPCHLAYVPSAEEIKKEKKRLRRNLQREFYYTSMHHLRHRKHHLGKTTNSFRHSRGFIPKDTPEPKVDIDESLLCEHLVFNFQKVSVLPKKPKLTKKMDEYEPNQHSATFKEKLATTKKIYKSRVKPSLQRISSNDEPDDVQVLMQSRDLHDSSEHTSSETPVFHQSSSYVVRTIDPSINLPPRFSPDALRHLKRKLLSPGAGRAFSKLGKLVGQINERPCPKDRHLRKFFYLAEFFDFKMYVRQESYFPGWPATPGPRYRVECYVFDDRAEYLASICMLQQQLHEMGRLYPNARRNFIFVDNAFELTPIPSMLNKCLKAILEAIHARPIYDLLGEITLNMARPPAAVFELAVDGN